MKKSLNLIKMPILTLIILCCCCSWGELEKCWAKEPIKIIYDTDVGNDIDDVLALAMLHNFQSRGECELLAITITKDNQHAVPFIQMVNTFYGRPDIPIGMVHESGVETFDGNYLKQTLESKDESGNLKFPFQYSDKIVTEATELLRKILAANEAQSVIIVQVGFSTNLARLLDTTADDISPLNGKELVAQKVRFISVMAGAFNKEFEKHTEYNVVKDIPSAQKLFAEWPTPIYVSGFEVGHNILMTGRSMSNDYEYVAHHPVKESYKFYRGLENDQCTWDLTSVLYAVRPNHGYFGMSEKGFVHVRDDSTTWFEPSEKGNAYYLTVTPEQQNRIQESFIWLCSELQSSK